MPSRLRWCCCGGSPPMSPRRTQSRQSFGDTRSRNTTTSSNVEESQHKTSHNTTATTSTSCSIPGSCPQTSNSSPSGISPEQRSSNGSHLHESRDHHGEDCLHGGILVGSEEEICVAGEGGQLRTTIHPPIPLPPVGKKAFSIHQPLLSVPVSPTDHNIDTKPTNLPPLASTDFRRSQSDPFPNKDGHKVAGEDAQFIRRARSFGTPKHASKGVAMAMPGLNTSRDGPWGVKRRINTTASSPFSPETTRFSSIKRSLGPWFSVKRVVCGGEGEMDGGCVGEANNGEKDGRDGVSEERVEVVAVERATGAVCSVQIIETVSLPFKLQSGPTEGQKSKHQMNPPCVGIDALKIITLLQVLRHPCLRSLRGVVQDGDAIYLLGAPLCGSTTKATTLRQYVENYLRLPPCAIGRSLADDKENVPVGKSAANTANTPSSTQTNTRLTFKDRTSKRKTQRSLSPLRPLHQTVISPVQRSDGASCCCPCKSSLCRSGSSGTLCSAVEKDDICESGLPEKIVFGIFHQIVSALRFLHRSCIAHGGLDLSKIFIHDHNDGFGPRVTVDGIDLSPKRVRNEEKCREWCDRRALPFSQLFAPEELRGSEHNHKAKSDVWRMGAILSILHTGHHPFDASLSISRDGCSEDSQQRVSSRGTSTHESASTVNVNGLTSLLSKMLENDPRRRCCITDIVQDTYWMQMCRKFGLDADAQVDWHGCCDAGGSPSVSESTSPTSLSQSSSPERVRTTCASIGSFGLSESTMREIQPTPDELRNPAKDIDVSVVADLNCLQQWQSTWPQWLTALNGSERRLEKPMYILGAAMRARGCDLLTLANLSPQRADSKLLLQLRGCNAPPSSSFGQRHLAKCSSRIGISQVDLFELSPNTAQQQQPPSPPLARRRTTLVDARRKAEGSIAANSLSLHAQPIY